MIFTNWRDGQPSEHYGGVEEDCVEMMKDGKWNDLSCNSTALFICEKEL
jgi:hypothetical protein